MKISEYLDPNHIFLDVRIEDKESVLRFVADTCGNDGLVENVDVLFDNLKKRELTMSTGIGGGIGLPHAVCEEITEAIVFLIRPERHIEFDALDSLPVDIIIAMVIPDKQTSLHVRILAGVSRLCKNLNFLDSIREADAPENLFEKIKILEQEMAFH